MLVVIDEIDGATGGSDNVRTDTTRFLDTQSAKSGQFIQKLIQLTIDKPAKKGVEW